MIKKLSQEQLIKEQEKKLNLLVKKLAQIRIKSPEHFLKLKQSISCQVGIPCPSNKEILKKYHLLLKKSRNNKKKENNKKNQKKDLDKKIIKKQNKIKSNPFLDQLKKCPVRTLSGVAVVAVLTKPWPCPGKCIYCPSEKEIPKSYLSGEPAVERAKLLKFNPYLQTQKRIQMLEENGHPTDKIELIVIGGTWSYLPKKYQKWFIKRCFDGANNITSKNLKLAQKKNETAKHRIIGITLETRPDYIDFNEIKQMRELGCTRVELGVQIIDDNILNKNKRGHQTGAVITATRLLKDAGIKVCYHIMPGLYGSNPQKDLKKYQELFQNSAFQPDMIKIYPCVVTKGSKLHKLWEKKIYRPYSDQTLINLLAKMKIKTPIYTRINRVIRDIPAWQIQGGSKISNLREVIQKQLKGKGLKCRCIRCREAKKEKINPQNAKLMIKKYPSSNGIEYFLSYEDKQQDKLLAFLRLRLTNHPLFWSHPIAIIRELHTYGQLVPIGKRKKAPQHMGFGKKLVKEAEKIAKEQGLKKITVISGIGVRRYYRKLGYRMDQTYLSKKMK